MEVDEMMGCINKLWRDAGQVLVQGGSGCLSIAGGRGKWN